MFTDLHQFKESFKGLLILLTQVHKSKAFKIERKIHVYTCILYTPGNKL